jgi:hypothetical protein
MHAAGIVHTSLTPSTLLLRHIQGYACTMFRYAVSCGRAENIMLLNRTNDEAAWTPERVGDWKHRVSLTAQIQRLCLY